MAKKKTATRKRRKSSAPKKTAIKRVSRSPVMAKRKSRTVKRKSSVIKKGNPIESVLFGLGSFLVSSIGANLIDNKLAKIGGSLAPGMLGYFLLKKNFTAIATGSAISTLLTALSGYASEDLKTQIKEMTGMPLNGDGVYVNDAQAKLLLGAYKKALSGDSNTSPLSGEGMDYVVSGNDYVVSGSNSAQPFA